MSTFTRSVRGRNPLVLNATALDTRARLRIVGLIGLAAIAVRLVLGDGVTVPVLVVVLAVSLWKYPPAAAALIGFAAMSLGGSLLFIAPVAIVLIARWWNRQELHIERSVAYAATTVVWAVVALLLSLLFISLTAGRSAFGEGAASGSDSAVARFVRELLGLDDASEPGDVTLVPGTEQIQPIQPPEPRDRSWLWIVLVVIGLLLLAAIVWAFIQRRRAAALLPTAAPPLARLEQVGESLGQKRQSSEGAIDYGWRLARATGDPRLARTGGFVSSEVYESRTADAEATETRLADLETAPPVLSSGSIVRRIRDRVRRVLRRTR
ncbi:MAG: hypothetical protein AAF567_12510 [Actinomycetota bacterium]